jgi:hypothetical protein
MNNIIKAVIISAITATWLAFAFQTKVAPDQVKNTITVVEWAVCDAASLPTAPPPKWDCRGFELFRFRMADQTLKGPYIAVPPSADFVMDNLKWKSQPLQ